MKELLKMLNIKEINYLYLDYTDNHGNFKTIEIDHRQEQKDKQILDNGDKTK